MYEMGSFHAENWINIIPCNLGDKGSSSLALNFKK